MKATVITRTIIRYTVPFIMMFSFYLLFRGHQLPGGGFIAGLMTGAAIVLEYMGFGIRNTRKFYHALPYIFGSGLALAFLTGVGGMWFGGSFLKSGFWFVDLPVLGHVELASAFAFDLGVYFVVVGIIVTILSLLSEEKRA